MTIKLTKFNDERLTALSRACGKVRDAFKEIFEHAAVVIDPAFPVRGIDVALAPDGESITITYRRVAIDLILTQTNVKNAPAGKVTVRLTRHPLIDEPADFGVFSLSKDGETDLAVASDVDASYIGENTLNLLMTLVEKAVYYDPSPKRAAVVGISI